MAVMHGGGNMIKNILHSLFSLRTLKIVLALLFVVTLSACGDDKDQMVEGRDTTYEEHAKCWQTLIVGAVTNNINKIYKKSKDLVASNGDGGVALLAVAFAVWMAFKLLKILSSSKEENIGETWTEIGQKLFLVGFCATAVSSGEMVDWTLNTFLIPFYNTIMELASAVMGQKPPKSYTLGIFGDITFSAQYSHCSPAHLTAADLENSIIPMTNCLVCQISERLNSGVRIGLSLFQFGLKGLLAGILMILMFVIAKLFFILFIVDGLFRLNFAAYLFPLLIVGVPFSFTRKWSKHGFLMFLNSAGIMLFLGLLISISILALESILMDMIAGNYLDEEHMSGRGPMFLALLLISTLLINIPAMGAALADKFIEGGRGMEFQEKVSQFVATNVKRLGAAALSGITAGATSSINMVAEKYEVSRKALDRVKHLKDKASDLAGYNDE